MSKNVFLTYFFHFKLVFSLFSATLEHIDKHIQYKSQVAASQHVKLKNNFLKKLLICWHFHLSSYY